MSSSLVARVAFDSALPQLDRLFDYEVPSELSTLVQPGQLVEVPFGRNAKTRQGFVIEVAATSDFKGELSKVASVVSPRVLLTPSIIQLCKKLADRQALSFGELLKSACPDRMVRVDKTWPGTEGQGVLVNNHEHEAMPKEQLISLSVTPGIADHNSVLESRWLHEIERVSHRVLESEESVIVCVPDFRDVARLKNLLEKLGLGDYLNVYETGATKSEQFARHLRAIDSKPQIVVGSRNALYAPLSNLGAVVLWDEGDEAHQDESSPYLHSRDVALVRQSIEDCQLIFMQHSKSPTLKRLENIGYLKSLSESHARPQVSFSSDGFRVDSLAHRVIKEGLKTGPVLVQVAAKGTSTSISCGDCGKRSACTFCAGPLWENAKQQVVCRVCAGFNLQIQCRACNSQKTKRGRAGATRTLQEFGKSFPGTRLIESTGETELTYLKAEPAIVVSTAGAEPVCEVGYSAIVLLDAELELSRDHLDATEQAVRKWANSLSLLAPSGRAAIIGVPPELGQSLSLWQVDEISAKLLQERVELGFPPAVRLVSVSGSSEDLTPVKQSLVAVDGVRILGISTLEGSSDSRLIAAYPYSAGAEVAKVLRVAALTPSLSKRYSKSGRIQRPLTIKMDDAKVL
jgi:primosomal protein N' (replication factor Y)